MTSSKLYSLFKHTFIPHEGNEYKPHFFRELAVAILLITSVFLLGVSAGSSFFLRKTVLGESITSAVLVDLANETRLAYNASPLTRNPLLDKAAQLKGEDMSARGYFAHDSPDGITPWYWFDQAGYVFVYAGENLAVNFSESKQVQDAWLGSPKHKDNLINNNFKEIGIATVDGIYKNNPTIFVVQMFGTPARVATAKSKNVAPLLATSSSTTPTPKSLATLTSTTTSEVRGETKEQSEAKATVIKQQTSIEKVVDTPELVIVKNTEEELIIESTTTPSDSLLVTYAPWYGQIIFGGSGYISTFYKILIGVVLIALLAMILIEMKRQHYKHIAYGVLVLTSLGLLLFINQAFVG